MKRMITSIATAALLSACGGSDSDVDDRTSATSDGVVAVGNGEEADKPSLTALFKDTVTEGLDYTVEGYSARTDENGAFSYYSEDDIITFSVGGVVLGSVRVQDVLTPIDLFVDGSSEQLQVQNIVRFLLALDEDGDPSNGIVIPTAVAEQAVDWGQLEWNDDDFSNAVLNTIGREFEIPTNGEARTHIESTYNCMYAGLWLGDYGGSDIDQGRFFTYIDALTGQASTATYSLVYPSEKLAASSQPMSYKNTVLLVSGSVSTGSVLNVKFPTITEASGTWKLADNEPGTLSADRFNKDLSYQNRITAVLLAAESDYSQDTKYYVALDISDSGYYKAAVHTFNEEISGGVVVRRISEQYLAEGKLIDNQTEIALTSSDKRIGVTTDFSTNTVVLKNDSDVTMDAISGGYCKLL